MSLMTTALSFEQLCEQGRMLTHAGHYEKAGELYRRALALRPDSLSVHYQLGLVCFRLSELQEAIDHFHEACRLDAQDAAACLTLGAAYNHARRYSEALGVLRQAIQLQPDRAESHYNLGVAHRGLGQIELAIRAFREAVHQRPRLAKAHFELAHLYRELGRLSEAVVHYEQVLALWPGHLSALIALRRARGQQHAGEERSSGDG